MPSATHRILVRSTMERVWEFASRLDNVARCMPGYQSHQELDPTTSLWQLKGDVGIFQRTVTFRAEIQAMNSNDSISFSLTGVSENVNGRGTFRARPAEGGVEVDLELGMEGQGVAGKLVNALLAHIVPRDLETLGANLAREVEMAGG